MNNKGNNLGSQQKEMEKPILSNILEITGIPKLWNEASLSPREMKQWQMENSAGGFDFVSIRDLQCLVLKKYICAVTD